MKQVLPQARFCLYLRFPNPKKPQSRYHHARTHTSPITCYTTERRATFSFSFRHSCYTYRQPLIRNLSPLLQPPNSRHSIHIASPYLYLPSWTFLATPQSARLYKRVFVLLFSHSKFLTCNTTNLIINLGLLACSHRKWIGRVVLLSVAPLSRAMASLEPLEVTTLNEARMRRRLTRRNFLFLPDLLPNHFCFSLELSIASTIGQAIMISLHVIAQVFVVWLAYFTPYTVHGAPTLKYTNSRRQTSDLNSALLRSFVRNDTMDPEGYTPPSTCTTPCEDLLTILETCEDDSCVCNQSGVNAFIQ